MKSFILSLDQGTTGTTALLIDADTLELTDKLNQEFKQIFPKPGWVEHDLNDIWSTVEYTVSEILTKNNLSADQIKCIGVTNQRETTCAFDSSGTPLANAIVWQDRRTGDYCNEKSEKYSGLQKKTGLPLDPYFSGTKMNWLLNNNDQVKAAANKSDLKLSNIDTFLVYKLTSGKSFVTEPSNASRTLLMDLETCHWDDGLLDFFGVDKNFLPQIKDSFGLFGETSGLSFLPDGIPITCILGDQQAALFGQAGYESGDLKCTYGTGAFILLNTGKEKTYSQNGLLTTVAYKNKGEVCYALEGASYIAGAAVQWLRDNLNVVVSSPEIEALANSVSSLDQLEHLIFMPFFTGIGSPHWKSEAKGAIVGLTRDTGKPEIARACLDGIALSINDSISALVADSPTAVNEIRVDGGAAANNLLMQIQANFSNKTIIRPKVIETTAYGVALGAMVGLGEISLGRVKELWKKESEFKVENKDYYSKKQGQWDSYIKKLFY